MSSGRPRTSVLVVDGLTVALDSGTQIIDDVSFALSSSEVLGLVGESGSGKSTLARALLGYVRPGARITTGSVRVCDEEVVGRTERELRALRGGLVSYVPQNPATSLNPAARIEAQVLDRLRRCPKPERNALVTRALERAQLPVEPAFSRRFPHELSGGQQQRALIAMAMASEPRVIVLDEPTTGLDVITQAALLDEMGRLRDAADVALVYVSHDIAAVASIADRIAVMYAGRIVELGAVDEVLGSPRHPYTCGLIESLPDPATPLRLNGLPGVAVGVGEWPPGCSFAPRCRQVVADCTAEVPSLEEVARGHHVSCIRWSRTPVARRAVKSSPTADGSPTEDAGGDLLRVESLSATHGRGNDRLVVATDVTFSVRAGQCVALVGQSGSGKTTIARCVAGLHEPEAGQVSLRGEQLPARAADRSVDARRRIQIVFQNPDESLNPRHLVEATIVRPARMLAGLSEADARAEMYAALERVRLPRGVAERYPGELSGGERQRVAIARALAARPEVLICDEITSSLDVSVQGAVLDLLADLRVQLGLAMLFISHDLGVVASIADWVLVLEQGRICEAGPVDVVLAEPEQPYTRRLLDAAPRLDVAWAHA